MLTFNAPNFPIAIYRYKSIKIPPNKDDESIEIIPIAYKRSGMVRWICD
jgi:hypothetical protein